MRKNIKKQRGFSNFGFSTILLSFVMICVVTFSALSLVTAYSDYKLSQKVADKNQVYYEALERVYAKLVTLDNLLVECYQSSDSESDYYSMVMQELTEYGTLENSSTEYILSFKEDIATDQYFSIKLTICYPTQNTDAFYEILEWKSVYEKEAPEDEILDLI